jgi:cell wall assembly regulator SMI1
MAEILERPNLAAFERQLRDLDLPLVRYLRPGLSAAELDAGELRLGFQLPHEARIWFGWHDGVDLAPWPPEQTLGSLQFLTLEDAIGSCHQNREIAVAGADGDEGLADAFWKPRWLALAVPGYGVNVVIDCSGAIDAPVPVYIVDFQNPDQAAAPRCASMKELVLRWSSGLERGSWSWNIRTRNWDVRVGDVPDDEADALALLGGA